MDKCRPGYAQLTVLAFASAEALIDHLTSVNAVNFVYKAAMDEDMPPGHKAVYQIVSDQIVADAEKDPSPMTMARFVTYETLLRNTLQTRSLDPSIARPKPRSGKQAITSSEDDFAARLPVHLKISPMQHRDMIEAEAEHAVARDEGAEEANRMIEDALHRHLLAPLKEFASLVDP
jgi:hypothetical protein